MMRNVLHLIGSFHEGGSERQAIQLARLLKETGRYGVNIACLDASGVLLKEVTSLGFGDIPQFPLTSFYDRNAFKQLRRFARFLSEREIDVVHTHDFYTNVFGMPGAAIAGVPVRIASRRETTGWRTSAQRFVERRAYALAHAVVVNAEAVRKQLIGEGLPDRKAVTIYNGLDTARVKTRTMMGGDEALQAMGLATGETNPLVTIVANLRHKVKNHSMFLRAARTVSRTVPEARFVIAGEGELTESVRKEAEALGLADRVFFIGRCERIAELLDLSSICVLSSTAEGFSNSILEYMAAGRPVVATDVGGASEAVVDGQSGYLVRSDDDAAMASRIILLLRDCELARAMGGRGREIVEQTFSCETQLHKVLELYDRLLAEARPLARRASKRSSKISLEAQQ
ncbi:MAG TPA: glycosyltransferase [Blastocatellia bacterium]|nr:glycosyltransferase [Blastocatellia bacterium]